MFSDFVKNFKVANNFTKFIIEIKEKFPEGISNNDFEKLLLKNNESFLFIKKIVKNLENTLHLDFTKDYSFFPHQDSTNSLPSTHGGHVSGPLKLVKKGLVPNFPTSSKVFEPLNILGKRVLGTSNSQINVPGPISVKKGLVPNLVNSSNVFEPLNALGRSGLGPFKINVSGPVLVKEGLVPNLANSTEICGPLSPCHNRTTRLVSSPESSTNTASNGIGVTVFKFNEVDLKKDMNSLAKKYKLDNLFVANILINSDIPNAQINNVIASNCYFKLDDINKNKITFPCEWKSAQGRNGWSFFGYILKTTMVS